MARTKFVVEDSWESIERDLLRVGMDAADAMRQELAIAIGEIIDATPVLTGMAASGWDKAAKALKVNHKPITPRRYSMSLQEWVDPEASERARAQADRQAARFARSDKRAQGTAYSRYREVTTGKSGKKLNSVLFEAANGVKHMTYLEYGHTVYVGGGKSFRLPGMHMVRDAVRAMKKRIGPHFAKVMKANIQRPKRYKRKTI